MFKKREEKFQWTNSSCHMFSNYNLFNLKNERISQVVSEWKKVYDYGIEYLNNAC